MKRKILIQKSVKNCFRIKKETRETNLDPQPTENEKNKSGKCQRGSSKQKI